MTDQPDHLSAPQPGVDAPSPAPQEGAPNPASPGPLACIDGTAPTTTVEWSTLNRHERRLLGDQPTLTLAQLAQAAGTSVDMARRFWRAMGFADVSDDAVRFTASDVASLARVVGVLGSGEADGVAPAGGEGATAPGGQADGGASGPAISLASAMELLRAQSFTMDRLVLWQMEALVSDFTRRLGLDDTSARLVTLDHIDDMIPLLREQLDYVWRRHMAALISRTESEIAKRGRESSAGPDLYPLTRSLGFVDIVSFTQRAQSMGSLELKNMLDDFENTARDVVTSRGARVVKTIGDAVMYVADDVVTAADVVTALVAELQRRPMMRVRASLVQGKVVSRSGDVFGPPVNLASRLVDTAEPGGIRMDTGTARALMDGPAAAQYVVRECHEVVAKGIGNIVPWSLERVSHGT